MTQNLYYSVLAGVLFLGFTRGDPHRRQPVMSRSHRFAHLYQAWHSCVVQREERSLCSDECLRES
jgi:hypothetical protein